MLATANHVHGLGELLVVAVLIAWVFGVPMLLGFTSNRRKKS